MKFDNVLLVDRSEFSGVYYNFFYEVVPALIISIGLNKIKKQLLLDLVIIRIWNYQARVTLCLTPVPGGVYLFIKRHRGSHSQNIIRLFNKGKFL